LPPQIWLDGKYVQSEVEWLSGDPDDGSLGGRVEITAALAHEDIWMYAEAGQEIRLSRKGPHAGGLYRIGPGGKKTLIAATISVETDDAGKRVVRNPLSGLSRAELRKLRFVSLSYWNANILRQLKQTDARRLCILVEDFGRIRKPMKFPSLPDVPCLTIYETDTQGFGDFAALSAMRSVRYLQTAAGSNVPRLLPSLAPLTKLRILRLGGATLRGSGAPLANLVELREASLISTELKDVQFVRHLRRLRALDVSYTDVRDLSPLNGHPTLERCNAEASPVRTLPAAHLPRLKELNLLVTSVAPAMVARFRRLHPRTKVKRTHRELLLPAVSGATRLRIVRKNSQMSSLNRPTVLVEETNPKRVRWFIQTLRYVVQQGKDPNCSGTLLLQFYRGPKLLATLTIIELRYLSWTGWPACPELDAISRRLLLLSIRQGRLTK